MNISLTAEQEKFIHQLVESGKCISASDAVSQAVRLLQDRYIVYQGRLAELQKEITIGIKASERGEVFDSEEVFAELDLEIDKISQVKQ